VWARDLKDAIRDAGGFPLGEGFLTPRPWPRSLPSSSPCPRSSRNLRLRRRAPGRRGNQASRTSGEKGAHRWDFSRHEPQAGCRRGRPTGPWRAWSGAARSSRAGWE
jgi:hypothetical protein